MDGLVGAIVDAIAFTSNIQTFPGAGTAGVTLPISVPLRGLLYFTGASWNYKRIRLSELAAHRDICEAP